MANTVYAYITLYYCIQWKSGIRVGKPKRVSLELLEKADFQPTLSKQEEEKIRELESRMNAMKN